MLLERLDVAKLFVAEHASHLGLPKVVWCRRPLSDLSPLRPSFRDLSLALSFSYRENKTSFQGLDNPLRSGVGTDSHLLFHSKPPKSL